MKRFIGIAFLFLFACFAASVFPKGFITRSSPAVAAQEHEDPNLPLILALDECIQQRFLDIDTRFGFRRIIKKGDTPHRFKPENAKELASVKYLSQARLDTVLYLGGRRLLDPAPESRGSASANLIKGPVYITQTDKQPPSGLPGPALLADRGTKAMRSFSSQDRYDFSVGDWSFIARPVRASSESCLNCHTSQETFHIQRTEPQSSQLQKGDPLGVLIYAYRKRP